jgi:hypothetical protein
VLSRVGIGRGRGARSLVFDPLCDFGDLLLYDWMDGLE